MPTESIGASLDPMAVLAGIGGALVGLAVGVVFTEIVFANDAASEVLAAYELGDEPPRARPIVLDTLG